VLFCVVLFSVVLFCVLLFCVVLSCVVLYGRLWSVRGCSVGLMRPGAGYAAGTGFCHSTS
jgi:hypothetical protein